MLKGLESLIKDVNINIILLIVLILILFSVVFYFRKGLEGFQGFPGSTQGPCVCDSTWMGNCNSYGAQTQEAVNQRNKNMIDKKEKNSDGSQAVAWYGNTPADCNQIPTNAVADAQRIYTNSAATTSQSILMAMPSTYSPTGDDRMSYRNLMSLLSSNKIPSWVTSTQMEEIRTFMVKITLYFLITNGQYVKEEPYVSMYGSLKAAGNTDSQILDKLLAKFNDDIRPVLKQHVDSKGLYNHFIAGALPNMHVNSSWVTPDMTKKAQVSLRRLGNYITSTGNMSSGGPNMSSISDVTAALDATRSTAAGDNDVQIFNKMNDILNKTIDTKLASVKNNSPSLPPETLVPVGVKIFCKLSDLVPYVPPVSLAYLMMAPLNTKLLILDAVTSEVVWDPINYSIENGIVQPFPTSAVSKSYVIYTDAIRSIPNLTVDMLPLQMQQDRDSIDKIIFNSLDTIVNLYKISVLDKIIPQASMYLQGLNSDSAAIFKTILNIVRFETIIYEKYSAMIEHFRN